jgi:hypothetical protein
MTSFPLLSLHDREFCGNSVGTCQELYGNAFVNSGNTSGTLWELHGNTLGNLWEQGIMYSIFYFYRILNFITMLYYTLCKYNTLYYVIHTLYCTIPTYCIIPTYYTLQCEVNCVSQHSTSILSIRFSLDNDYGTIIS